MFIVFRVYDDFTSATEKTANITSALSACAFYLADPAVMYVRIWRADTGKIIFEYDNQ